MVGHEFNYLKLRNGWGWVGECVWGTKVVGTFIVPLLWFWRTFYRFGSGQSNEGGSG